MLLKGKFNRIRMSTPVLLKLTILRLNALLMMLMRKMVVKRVNLLQTKAKIIGASKRKRSK